MSSARRERCHALACRYVSHWRDLRACRSLFARPEPSARSPRAVHAPRQPSRWPGGARYIVELSIEGLVVAVNDIVSFGGDRGPRGRRRLAAVAACVTVALAAALIWYLPGPHRHGGGQATPAARSLSQAAPEAAGPALATWPASPALMTGQPLPPGAGLRLLLGGRRPAWLQVPSGRTEAVRGLPGDASYQFIRIAGGWAVQPVPPVAARCGNCAPGPLPVYYLADGSTAVSRAGTADVAGPAAAPGALWLVSYRPGADMGTAAGTAQLVSVTGAALGPRLRLPAGYVISRGTRAGLLLARQQPGSGPGRYELWDPGTRRVTRSFVNVLAATPAEIAWQPACTDSCQVRVLQLPGGRAREIALPPRSTAEQGAFSPDGRLLAQLAGVGVTADGRIAANQLMVAAIASGRATAVPGTTVGGAIALNFGWQPGTRQLIAGVTAGTQPQPQWQIGAWQPGAARLATALARVPDESWPVIDQGPR